METWVLRVLPNSHNPFDEGFYTGKSYIYQGAKYAVVDKDIKSAKPYSTYPKAVAACKKMCFENYRFEAVRQSDFEIQNNECGTIQ